MSATAELTAPPSGPASDAERALIERAIAAIGPHVPETDHGLDVDAHAAEMEGRPDAAGVRAILLKDEFVRKTCEAYKLFDKQAGKARRSFERAISFVMLLALVAVLVALFMLAVPEESTRVTRAGFAICIAVVTYAVLSCAPRWHEALRKTLGKWPSRLVRGLGVVAFASYLYWGLPEQFQPIKEGLARDFSRGLPQPFQPFKEGFAGSVLTIVALFCAGAADFISGGMTARMWRGRRSMHSRWYDARGHAEAHRRQLFLAVLNAEPPPGTPKSDVPLLSQKLEYFRRYQIEVQQGYYKNKSKDNLDGAKKAEFARIIAFVLAVGLSVFSIFNLLSKTSEQGGGTLSELLHEGAAGWLVGWSHLGVDDLVLMIAMLALGAYAYLQLKSTLLREKVNHRRFGNALGQLRQATSVSPAKADHEIATPLRDARLAAVRSRHVEQKHYAQEKCAEVEQFLRTVNRLLATEVGDWNTMTPFTIIIHDKKPRLVSAERLNANEDFEQLVRELRDHKSEYVKARKISFVAARQATSVEKVETRLDGKESDDTANPGDWIVTNMDIERRIMKDKQGFVNTYVIRQDTFDRLYDLDHGEEQPYGRIYKAKGVVDAIEVAGGFDIVAPWGQRQQGPDGFILRNGDDVYGIHRDAFDKTYERLKTKKK